MIRINLFVSDGFRKKKKNKYVTALIITLRARDAWEMRLEPPKWDRATWTSYRRLFVRRQRNFSSRARVCKKARSELKSTSTNKLGEIIIRQLLHRNTHPGGGRGRKNKSTIMFPRGASDLSSRSKKTRREIVRTETKGLDFFLLTFEENKMTHSREEKSALTNGYYYYRNSRVAQKGNLDLGVRRHRLFPILKIESYSRAK